MAKCLVILNHKVNEEQIEDLQKNFSVNSLVFLPDELQEFCSRISPEASLNDLKLSIIFKIQDYIEEIKPDYVWIQGESTLCFQIQLYCFLNHIKLITATTKREVEEFKLPDGSVKKVSKFKHIRFRKLY